MTQLMTRGTARRLTLLVWALLMLPGCGNGPFMALPGGALDGPEAPYDPGTLPAEPGVIVIETNPSKPYSVKINGVNVGGQLYIDPAADRQWYQYLEADPRLRFRLAGADTVYPAVAVRETDTEVLARFEADRIVLRLDPR